MTRTLLFYGLERCPGCHAFAQRRICACVEPDPSLREGVTGLDLLMMRMQHEGCISCIACISCISCVHCISE